MSTKRNKAIARRVWEEVINEGNLSLLDEIVAKDVVDHSAVPGTAQGREGVKQMISMYRNAFSDFHATLEDLIAEEDKVVQRVTVRGTHTGELMGIPPTGKDIEISAIHISRFEDGLEVEHWSNADIMGMMQQLGVAPEPA